jgi:hypothetical protein
MFVGCGLSKRRVFTVGQMDTVKTILYSVHTVEKLITTRWKRTVEDFLAGFRTVCV